MSWKTQLSIIFTEIEHTVKHLGQKRTTFFSGKKRETNTKKLSFFSYLLVFLLPYGQYHKGNSSLKLVL
jgi:hypothetical protein